MIRFDGERVQKDTEQYLFIKLIVFVLNIIPPFKFMLVHAGFGDNESDA